LDFAEGLRVIGVRPDEKLALFADNSCRWLVADQGASICFLFLLHFQCIESRNCQLHKSYYMCEGIVTIIIEDISGVQH
jgi:hypothetical protein